jgi:hypothetical protein
MIRRRQRGDVIADSTQLHIDLPRTRSIGEPAGQRRVGPGVVVADHDHDAVVVREWMEAMDLVLEELRE